MFIPKDLLEFITERIEFCDACIQGIENSESTVKPEDRINILDEFKGGRAELELAKTLILSGNEFNAKRGKYMAKCVLRECIYTLEITLHSTKKFLSSKQCLEIRNLIQALKEIE